MTFELRPVHPAIILLFDDTEMVSRIYVIKYLCQVQWHSRMRLVYSLWDIHFELCRDVVCNKWSLSGTFQSKVSVIVPKAFALLVSACTLTYFLLPGLDVPLTCLLFSVRQRISNHVSYAFLVVCQWWSKNSRFQVSSISCAVNRPRYRAWTIGHLTAETC